MRKGTSTRFNDPSSRGKRAFVKSAARAFMSAAKKPRVAKGINSVSVFQPPRTREMKFKDTSSVQSPAIAGTGTLSGGLCLVPAAVDSNGRIGAEMSVKSMQWRQSCSLATTTGGGSIRTVLVYDKSPNGAPPTIFGVPASDIFNADNINAQMALQNRDRFVVLQDIIVPVMGTQGPQADYQKGYRKVALPQVYSSNVGNIGALNTGNIIAVTWASPGFTVAPPTVTLETRFRFEDA